MARRGWSGGAIAAIAVALAPALAAAVDPPAREPGDVDSGVYVAAASSGRDYVSIIVQVGSEAAGCRSDRRITATIDPLGEGSPFELDVARSSRRGVGNAVGTSRGGLDGIEYVTLEMAPSERGDLTCGGYEYTLRNPTLPPVSGAVARERAAPRGDEPADASIFDMGTLGEQPITRKGAIVAKRRICASDREVVLRVYRRESGRWRPKGPVMDRAFTSKHGGFALQGDAKPFPAVVAKPKRIPGAPDCPAVASLRGY